MSARTVQPPSRPATRPATRSLLRVSLQLDAVVSAGNGVAYLLAAEPLADLLGFSVGSLRGVGAFLLVYGGLVGLTGNRRAIPRPAVFAVVAMNLLWTLESVVVALAPLGSPTAVGTGWVLLQAVAVAGFAGLQLLGLRRARAAAAARA